MVDSFPGDPYETGLEDKIVQYLLEQCGIKFMTDPEDKALKYFQHKKQSLVRRFELLISEAETPSVAFDSM
jgi:hypothetical protein